MTGGPGGSDGLGDEVGTAVGLATGVGGDAVGLGEAEAVGPTVDALATGVAVDAVGLGTGVGTVPGPIAEQDGEASRVTCRAGDCRCRPAS
jgi:hypothetical protein